MPLPHEEEIKAIIAERLKPEIDLAQQILDLATGIFGGMPMSPGDGLDNDVVVVVLGLLAKASKQYRTIMMLVEGGLEEAAGSNARMMFETMLVVNFLMRRRVNLRENGTPLPEIPGKPLTTRFRTRLYLANDAFNNRKFVRELAKIPGYKRIPKAVHDEVDRVASEWEADIGSDWTKRVKKKGYAGVSIKDLADSLALGALYATAYRLDSAGVHAADATAHTAWGGEEGDEWSFKVTPTTDTIANSLGFASLMIIEIVQLIDRRLGLGVEARAIALKEEAKKMRLDFPDA